MSIPRATARLQLHKEFTFDDAAGIVDYYAALGISHLYLSPILTARPGSMHGYDIVDPTRINPELGGEPALRRLVQKLRGAGMGLIADIVPNHMGVGGADNPWWLHVLEWGRRSRYARWFDIEWNSPDPMLRGKILLPFLGDQYAQTLRSGELRLQFDADNGQLYLGYFAHRFPLAPWTYGLVLRHGGTAIHAATAGFSEIDPDNDDAGERHEQRCTVLRNIARSGEGMAAIKQALATFSADVQGGVGRLHRLLERQNYRLTWWRNAAEEINWRRFFEVSDLAGIRVELDDVFDATHALILRLYEEGLIDGVRIDHVDGLADPIAYCRKLRAALTALSQKRPADAPDDHPYIVVEKILTHGETLRTDWAIDGTTGYDFMEQVGALLHDENGAAPLGKMWAELTGDNDNFAAHVANARRQLLRENFVGEFAALTRAVHAVARTELDTRDISQAAIARVLTELLVSFPVYRTYWSEDGRGDADRDVIERALNEARRNLASQDLSLLDTLIMLFDTANIDSDASADAPELRRLAVRRFEQLTPPLAAKSVEDTVFYRYGRLLSRNEVGGDPEYFSSSIDDFHAFNLEHAAHFPQTMLATATHDHKRGEDVRARLAVLSEVTDEWEEAVRRWKRLHTDLRVRLPTEDEAVELVAPALDAEIMLYQMIFGAWPPDLRTDDADGLQQYADRLAVWQQKALREAKQYSSWAMPNDDYEQACRRFLMALFDRDRSSAFLDEMVEWVQRTAIASTANSLTQTLLRLTSPGVPDLYQGTEFWDFSLVDPDNRRPVDYAARRELLAEAADMRDLLDTSQRADGPHRQAGEQLGAQPKGQLKQPLIRTALALRTQTPGLFTQGEYIPLRAEGPLADHVIAFLRRHQGHTVLTAALRHTLLLVDDNLSVRQDGNNDGDGASTLLLPDHLPPLTDLLTGKRIAADNGRIDIAALFCMLPIVLAIAEN